MNWKAWLKDEKKDFLRTYNWFKKQPREERAILLMHGFILLTLGAAAGIMLVMLLDVLLWLFS
jgi:hypothetical protein